MPNDHHVKASDIATRMLQTYEVNRDIWFKRAHAALTAQAAEIERLTERDAKLRYEAGIHQSLYENMTKLRDGAEQRAAEMRERASAIVIAPASIPQHTFIFAGERASTAEGDKHFCTVREVEQLLRDRAAAIRAIDEREGGER